MNKIIPIVAIVAVIAVVRIIVTTSTGGISSVNYESMTCEELFEERKNSLYLPTTQEDARELAKQQQLIKDVLDSKCYVGSTNP